MPLLPAHLDSQELEADASMLMHQATKPTQRTANHNHYMHHNYHPSYRGCCRLLSALLLLLVPPCL